jgi:hypothetical protein
MRRGAPCAHLRPDYDRMEQAHYITVDPATGEISWPPTRIEDELKALGLLWHNGATEDGDEPF